MKKMLCAILTLVLVFAFSTSIFATDLDQIVTDPIDTVDYVGVNNFTNSITKANGIVSCRYRFNAKSGYVADVTTILQKSSGGEWSEVTRWSHSKVGDVNTTKTKAVTSGYSYRIKTYANVYNGAGNFVEQAFLISNTV